MWKILNIIKYIWKSTMLQFKIIWAKIRKQKVGLIVVEHIVNTKIKIYLTDFITKAIKSKEFIKTKNKALWITKKFDGIIEKIAKIYVFKDNKNKEQTKKIFQAIIDKNPGNDKWAAKRIVELTLDEIWSIIKKDKFKKKLYFQEKRNEKQ